MSDCVARWTQPLWVQILTELGRKGSSQGRDRVGGTVNWDPLQPASTTAASATSSRVAIGVALLSLTSWTSIIPGRMGRAPGVRGHGLSWQFGPERGGPRVPQQTADGLSRLPHAGHETRCIRAVYEVGVRLHRGPRASGRDLSGQPDGSLPCPQPDQWSGVSSHAAGGCGISGSGAGAGIDRARAWVTGSWSGRC